MKWGHRIFLPLSILLLTGLVWLGIDWGLPSRLSDHYLFAPNPIWTGTELAKFDQSSGDESIGADVDINPLDHSQGKIVLNDTEEKRAEIVRRYRLYSNQPDEMITFRALQRMKPGDLQFDPHLYQYGGVWIYGTGALLKIAGIANYVTLTSDKTFYYDHPEAFGKFYIVARFYTLITYALLLIIVAALAHKLTESRIATWVAVLFTGIAPVIFAMSHEAKPHLPGAMLMTLSCLFAINYLNSGRLRDLLLTSAACGLALGTILSSAIIISILPTMIFLHKNTLKTRNKHFLIAFVTVLTIYFLTNPYVLINLLTNRAALSSNLSNTQAMYHLGSLTEIARSTFVHLNEASSLPLFVLALIGLIFAILRIKKDPRFAILLVPMLIVLIQFTLLSANKPGEYARFAIFPVIIFILLAAGFISRIGSPWIATGMGLLMLGTTFCFYTYPYIEAFNTDTTPVGSSRLVAAANIDSLQTQTGVLQLFAEPAPYSVPPIGLWGWKIILTPPGSPFIGDVVVRAEDQPDDRDNPPGYLQKIFDTNQSPAPITWANKPIVVWVKQTK